MDQFDGQGTTYAQNNLLILNRESRRLKWENLRGRAGPGLEVRKCTRASAVIDFDNDGDPDIATTEMNDTPSLLRCDLRRTEAGPNWITVRLRGNPKAKVPLDPAGAVVTVKAGNLTQHRVFLIGSSFQCSEDPRLHFGLGPNPKVDSVEVLWPDNHRTLHQDLPPNRHHTLTYK